MKSPVSYTYDQVPYPLLSHSNTHPDRLATLAVLLGMRPAPVEHCRVLELGCAAGGNLIPMAYGLPDSEFLGIDNSERQISRGHEILTKLELNNISLKCMDILDIDESLGKFDYIIAHGVFSWVPHTVQEKILEIFHSLLAENGVGLISYNTFPGWHMINIARGIMRYHTRNISDPGARVDEARAAIQFYSEATNDRTNGYYGYLQMYSNYINGIKDESTRKTDSALLHDELEDLNQPYYLTDFVQRAESHGLQYLADFNHAEEKNLPAEAVEVLKKKSSTMVELEQACDFLVNRTFRQTLLCHQEINIQRKVTPGILKNFFIASPALPVSEKPSIHAVIVEKFQDHQGDALNTDHPLSKAAMLCLGEIYPESLSFDELLLAAVERLNAARLAEGVAEPLKLSGKDALAVGANLLQAYSYSAALIELHVYRPMYSLEVGEYPTSSKLARQQALEGETITSMRHERVEVDGFDRFLLMHLDGTCNREKLVDLLMDGPVKQGILTVGKNNQDSDSRTERELLTEDLENRLRWLAKAGLLVN